MLLLKSCFHWFIPNPTLIFFFPHLVIIVYLLPDVVVIIVTRWYGKCVIGGNMNLKAESHAEFLKRSVLLLLP